jgi:hypothetical protein
MTAFAINSGGTEYYDAKTGGSTNATNDTYTISAGSTFVIRTDTYACPNHSSAFGSLDNVTSSGTGGTIKWDPTYTREIAFTGGSGTVPAYGTTISQGGVSGVFLGVWADWQSQTVAPAAAMPAAGYIKLGGITGGSFAAGALTGITATCSGADKQSWIETLVPDAAVWTVSRLLTMKTDAVVWYEIGTTNGSAGQVIPCPTTGSFAGTFPGIWVETGSGTGVYDAWFSAGTAPANSATRTDATCKMFWQTTSGIRIGNDGTNNVGFLPPTGCKVRIPAVIINTCTRTGGSGSGNRVLPSNTPTTRGRIDAGQSGVFDLRGMMFNNYLSIQGGYSLNMEFCTVNRYASIQAIKTAPTVTDVICSPNQASSPTNAFEVTNCRSGGTFTRVLSMRYDATTGNLNAVLFQNCYGLTLSSLTGGCVVYKGSASSYAVAVRSCQSITYNACTGLGLYCYAESSDSITMNNTLFYDSLLSTTTGTSAQVSAVRYLQCTGDNVVNGVSIPLVNQGPYLGLVQSYLTTSLKVRGIGTYASQLALNSAVTGYIYYSEGGNSNHRFDRLYVTGTRVDAYNTQTTDDTFTFQHVNSDDADTTRIFANNTVVKSGRYAGSATTSSGVFGSHWESRFLSNTTGAVQIRFNEATTASASQVTITAGTPKFDALGKVLLTTINDQAVWEMPFYALGFTAFTNSLPSVAGTNATSAGSGVWGNHLIEFAINTGSGYGSWLTLTAANLTAQSITPSTGFKLKVRITCQVTSSTNAISNLQIAMDTTSAAQSTNLYPMDTYTLTLTDLVSGSDIVIRQAGTSTIIDQVDANAGTTYDYVYETPQAVDILVFKAGYKVKSQRNYSLASADVTLPLAQTVDLNYA